MNSLGRATQGVRVMRFKKAGDRVSSVAFIDNAVDEEIIEVVEAAVEEGAKEEKKEVKAKKKK